MHYLTVCCGLKEIVESYKVEFEQREVDGLYKIENNLQQKHT